MEVKDITKETSIPVFRFDPIKHRYFLGEKQLTGVTTVLGVLAKNALIQWAANEAVKYIKENVVTADLFEGSPESGIYYPVSEGDLEKARTAHARKRDKSADIGTTSHKWIESYIKAKIASTELPGANKELSVITDNFLKWVEEKKPKFLASEKVVYSKKHFYAGTLDFIAEIDGKVYLGDIKTGSGVYFEMFLQCAGYQLALEETEPEWKIEGHIIVNPTKDGKLNVETHYDYEATKEGFLAALKLYKLMNIN
jgi:hypothetical protein